MRLWSIHPAYLDRQGLLALWREALLARAVLRGRTQGYRNHPQLERFKRHSQPRRAICVYLEPVWQEAKRRGYRFDRNKLGSAVRVSRIPVPAGQVDYEFRLLRHKVKQRNTQWYRRLLAAKKTESAERRNAGTSEPTGRGRCIGTMLVHPLFRMVKGGIATWERPVDRKRTAG